jgi:hypothetical protein
LTESRVADVADHAEDGTITGTLRDHLGDDLPFVLKRVAPEEQKPAGGGRKKRRGRD